MNPASPASLTRLTWLLLGLSLLGVLLWFAHALGYWEDDAWIHLNFARSVAHGQGFAFQGHVVYGDTSPLWVWLLVAAHAVIPSWLVAGKALTVAGMIFALAAVFALSRSLVVARLGAAQARLFAAAMVLLLVVNPYFGYWAFSGMEALTAAGLACCGVMIANRRPLPPALLLVGATIAGIAPLLRPEMGFFSVLLALVLAWRLLTMPGSIATRLSLFAAGLALLLLPFGLWARYALRTFGSVLPTTNAAKRASADTSVLTHLLNTYGFGFPLVLLCLLLLAAWIVLALRPTVAKPTTPWSLLPLGSSVAILWTLVNAAFYIANHTYVQTRYIFVSAPVLTVVLLAVARLAWPRVYSALLVAGLAMALATSTLATWPSVASRVQLDRDYAQLAAVLDALPPNTPVAHYSIGEVGFLTQHPILDTGGILQPGILPFLDDAADNRRLRWMQEQGAAYVITSRRPCPQSTVVWRKDIPVAGWFLDPRRYRARDPLIVWTLSPCAFPPSR